MTQLVPLQSFVLLHPLPPSLAVHDNQILPVAVSQAVKTCPSPQNLLPNLRDLVKSESLQRK